MKHTLELINQMQADGVIAHYAIGGAVAATFYLEPAATVDVDVFVLLSNPAGALVSLSPIYEYLKLRGGVEDGNTLFWANGRSSFLSPVTSWRSRLWLPRYP